MLRVIQATAGRPVSYPVDPNAVFEPGMIAQLKVLGNDVFMGVSDGNAPFGIIDDIKTVAFTQPVIGEIVIIPVAASWDGYNFVSTVEASKELQNANISAGGFAADYPGLLLNEVNGILRAPVGSIANIAINGSADPNAIRVRVNYSYRVPNIPGEDSTIGSSKITIWFTRGIFQTDQYEMVHYAVNATLFVSLGGKLTAENTFSGQPGVAMCIVPPTPHNPMLEFLWL